MDIETKIFQRKRANFTKFALHGIKKQEKGYRYEIDFMGGAFKAVLTFDTNGKVFGSVIDNASEEEYLPLRITTQSGAYVSEVRNAYQEILNDIATKCYEDVYFAFDQANRISELIYEKYGNHPDFPWTKDANKSYGVFRHEDNSKWYGLVMQIRKSVFDKTFGDEEVNAINLKVDVSKRDEILKETGIYPGYHMNHTYWISIILDDSVSDERVMELVDTSYQLTKKK